MEQMRGMWCWRGMTMTLVVPYEDDEEYCPYRAHRPSIHGIIRPIHFILNPL